jgi:hypothetical protein
MDMPPKVMVDTRTYVQSLWRFRYELNSHKIHHTPPTNNSYSHYNCSLVLHRTTAPPTHTTSPNQP